MSNSESRKRLAANPDPDPHTPDWLPAHDAKVAARAWDEGWEDRDGYSSEPYSPPRHNPYRADEIERAGRAGGGA